MVSLTKNNSVGGTAATAGRQAGPHYFLRVPSTGFPGKHFLEFGLQVGTQFAKEEFARLVAIELTQAQQAKFRGYGDSPTQAKAGVNIGVFENVSTGVQGLNIKGALFKAFATATRVSKSAAMQRFNKLDRGTSPRLSSGRQASIASSFHYVVSGRQGGKGAVTLQAQFYGGKGAIAKVVAQNFGLRKPVGSERTRFKLSNSV